MNKINALNVEYIRPSRTIEEIEVVKKTSVQIIYIYNYEGYSFRFFSSKKTLEKFLNYGIDLGIHFDSEIELDEYLLTMN